MGSGNLRQDRVWIDATGKVWKIADLGDEHLAHILEFLDDRAGALKEAHVWQDYVNGPQPRGDMAQDAFEDEFMRILAEPARRWLHRQPLYAALKAEALRRDLIYADPPTAAELVSAVLTNVQPETDGAIDVVRERVVLESDGIGWLAMYPDGEVAAYASKAKALKAIGKRAKGLATGRRVVVTEIEWRS